LVALTLDKNRLCEHIQSIGTDFVYVSGREFVYWPVRFLTKKNGLLLLVAQRCTVSRAKREEKKRERERI
jgi:hypothetical protein